MNIHNTRLLKRSLIFVASMTLVMLAFVGVRWSYPQIMGVYYQVKGGKLLQIAMRSAGIKEDITYANVLLIHEPSVQMLEQAIENLTKAIEYSPNLAQAYLLLGRGNRALGRYDEAMSAYDKYSQLRPESPLGKVELALVYINSCISGTNDDFLTILVNNNQFCESQGLVKKAHNDKYITVSNILEVGNSLQQSGQYQNAEKWYLLATFLEPGQVSIWQTWYSMGIDYFKKQQWDKGLSLFEKVLVLQDQFHVSYYRGSFYYYIGLVYHWHSGPTQQAEKALDAYRMAIDDGVFFSDIESADAHYNLGVIYWWRRTTLEPEQYINCFRKALEINADHAWANLLLGRAIFLDYGNLTDSIAYIERSISLHPTNPWAYLYLGDVLAANHEVAAAKIQYQKALDLSPDFADALQRLEKLAGK